MHECQVLPAQVTIILTTSPTPSAPSTELVASVLHSLPAVFDAVPLVITFDGYTLTKTRAEGRLKRGQIPASMADTYPAYIENVKLLFGQQTQSEEFHAGMHTYVSTNARATSGRSVTFLRQKFRQGFAFSVKCALQFVQTPYVLVLQHDWVFTEPAPPFLALMQVMQDEAETVRYITFVARQSIRYEACRSGARSCFASVFQAARKSRSGRALQHDLIACLHFFDRPHLCSVALYHQVFAGDHLKRGDFLEDTFGTHMVQQITVAKTIETSIKAWSDVGTWMYYPSDGNIVGVRHTSGRTCLAKVEQGERIKQYILNSKAQKHKNTDNENA